MLLCNVICRFRGVICSPGERGGRGLLPSRRCRATSISEGGFLVILRFVPSPVGEGGPLAVDEELVRSVLGHLIRQPMAATFSLSLGHVSALALSTQFTTETPLRYPLEKAYFSYLANMSLRDVICLRRDMLLCNVICRFCGAICSPGERGGGGQSLRVA